MVKSAAARGRVERREKSRKRRAGSLGEDMGWVGIIVELDIGDSEWVRSARTAVKRVLRGRQRAVCTPQRYRKTPQRNVFPPIGTGPGARGSEYKRLWGKRLRRKWKTM